VWYSFLKHSGTACVNKKSHSFTCHPHMHPEKIIKFSLAGHSISSWGLDSTDMNVHFNCGNTTLIFNLVQFGHVVSEICEYTDRHTHIHITIFSTPWCGEVKNNTYLRHSIVHSRLELCRYVYMLHQQHLAKWIIETFNISKMWATRVNIWWSYGQKVYWHIFFHLTFIHDPSFFSCHPVNYPSVTQSKSDKH